MIIQRLLLPQLAQNVMPGHATILYGPRRSGKTTLIQSYLSSYTKPYLFLNADELVSREVLQVQDAKRFTELVHGYNLLVIDEAQRVDSIGLNLKIILDSQPQLAVIATGSASFDLANKINEPLTGRKTIFTLHPLSFAELSSYKKGITSQEHLQQWLLWGGYPQSIMAQSIQQKEQFLSELIGSYLYKDILELEAVKRADKIVDLLRLLAFQIGNEVSVAELASSLALNRETVDRYLDLLEKVFVIFRVNGFSRNLRKEIVKNSRFYFFDNGVRNALIQNFNSLNLRNDIGQLWENYIVSERRKTNQYNQNAVNSYFWRTYDLKEIDIIEESQGILHGFEIKWVKNTLSKSTQNEFKSAYPDSQISIVNRDNFTEFLT